MLEYDTVGVPKVTDINKNNGSRECITCQCQYFLEINFRFQSKVCNDGHDLLQQTMSFNDATIVSIKQKLLQNSFIRKDVARKLLGNADLTEKCGAL